ncbi:MAG: tetratricopeptide repeat protein, partial [Dehalococcoidia bacterium]|nr:tetratricopeptide repeat protein [Dehalococcoidia bacterium]
ALPSGLKSSEMPSQFGGKKTALTVLAVVLLTVGGLGSLVYQAYAAEALHKRSLGSQNGQEIYNLQTQSIQRFPWRADYHISLARTTFLLANQLSTQEDLTQEDQNDIRVLVAQSIEEAKRATELFPLNAGNWESLAQVYRSLIGLAKDAEVWAAESYQRAVTLDLFNPLLRVSFGGMYYQLGQYELAVEQFRAAVTLKSDYANAYFNLGVTYKELGRNDLAIQALETALKLAGTEAEGYQEAQQILEELRAQ